MTAADAWWTPWREAEDSLILHVDLRPHPGRERKALALLDQHERARCDKFLASGSRRRFVLCRAALRINLCERLGCTNRELSFGYLEHGKPYAKVGGAAPAPGASFNVSRGFNVSHSGDHGLIAFANREALGVDLEVRTPGRDFDGIGAVVYGPRERLALSVAAGTGKADLFYRLWSLKEALIKALGTGFSLDPSRFEVPRSMLAGERAALFRFPHLPSDRFWLEDLGESRFAAARACRLPGPAPRNRACGDASGPTG